MSTYMRANYICGICGHTFESNTIMSTNSFGSPDLDLRPPEMQRSTMPLWVKKCPNCGYVHSEIEKDGKTHANYIKSKSYITCENNMFKNDLASEFYQYALIELQDNNLEEAYNAFLHAAWACDDSNDKENAVICRSKAIALFERTSMITKEEFILRQVDLLRRARKFDDAILLVSKTRFKDSLLKKIASFQHTLCQHKDDDCFCVKDCDSIFMKLYDEPFELIKTRKKTIEVRCNDKKRSRIKKGDTIIFCRASNLNEKIFVDVVDVKKFATFKELYSSYPMDNFGVSDKTIDDMLLAVNEIYTQEEQHRYGAVAITIKKKPVSLSDLIEGL